MKENFVCIKRKCNNFFSSMETKDSIQQQGKQFSKEFYKSFYLDRRFNALKSLLPWLFFPCEYMNVLRRKKT